MSKALPGENYCENHQGNHSHYAKENCTVCKLEAERDALLAKLNQINEKIGHFADKPAPDDMPMLGIIIDVAKIAAKK